MAYFNAIIAMPKGLINELDLIEDGCYVKYLLNENVKFIKIKEKHALSNKLIGHKSGDEIKVKKQFSQEFDTISILRVMDKYLYLHDKILEEVSSDPHAGYPMQSFEFNPHCSYKSVTS